MHNKDAGPPLRKAVEVLDQANPLLREARELILSRRGREANEKIIKAIQLYDTFLSTDPPLDLKPGFSKDVELVRNLIQNDRNYAGNILKLNEDIEKGEGELFLLVLAPYFLSIGLAVRVAKVTAKLITVEEPKPNQLPRQTELA
jgi:hypothetical protein